MIKMIKNIIVVLFVVGFFPTQVFAQSAVLSKAWQACLTQAKGKGAFTVGFYQTYCPTIRKLFYQAQATAATAATGNPTGTVPNDATRQARITAGLP